MKLKSLSDIDLKGKRVLFRVAYDVPLIEKNGRYEVGDDTRIQSSIKTLRYLLARRCKVIILTWLGRPGGVVTPAYSLAPVAKRLSEIIKRDVALLDGITGPVVEKKLSEMNPKDIVMLENVRFSPQEEHHDDDLSRTLSGYADCVVFDAFAQSHRDYPSTTGILSRLPSVCGYDMASEIAALGPLLIKPTYPFVVVLGGAKISDKIDLIANLLPKADVVLIGGALAHNFLKARGIKIAASLVEGQSLELKREQKKLFAVAEDIMRSVKDTYVNLGPGLSIPKLVLPIDLVACSKVSSENKTKIINLEGRTTLPWNWTYMDIGPQTAALYSSIVKKAKLIFWNGPLGYTEKREFAAGTLEVAKAIAGSHARSIVGGGDTEGFLRAYRLKKSFSYVSTGGGAVLEFLSGRELPVLSYLKK
ncbi:phosphoglycerate kinase [Candidatus Uhrbacteria bacterium]|nr:phosphoglycerate kinase [Candidatus Uhrbacteria bacterium]